MITATVARGCVHNEIYSEKLAKGLRKDARFFAKDRKIPKERFSKDARKIPRKTVKNAHKDAKKDGQISAFRRCFYKGGTKSTFFGLAFGGEHNCPVGLYAISSINNLFYLQYFVM